MSGYEKLDSKWIDEHKKGIFMDGKGRKKHFVWVDDLQGLFVLKQGEVDQAYKDGYEKGKEHATKIIKPTIPGFVAEWIEFKKKSEIPYKNVLQAIDELVNSSTSKAHDWVLKTSENKDAFARAWLDGYTVEEQKYYVLDESNIPFLSISNGEVNREPMHMTIYAKGRDNAQFALTEKEIKDYDPRYMTFAKPVEELEE